MSTKLPFSTESGYFNGDMFQDWYDHEPSDEDRHLWQFLHNWERRITDRKLEKLATEFAKFVHEEDDKRILPK